jgi:hypothetical protein
MATLASFPVSVPVAPEAAGYGSPMEYGGAVLQWLMADGAGWYGLLTDEQLRRADAAGIVAGAPRDVHPGALAAIAEVRGRIARTLATRERERVAALQRLADALGDDEPEAGAGRPAGATPAAPDPRLEAVQTIAAALLRVLRHDDDSDHGNGDGGRRVLRPVPPPTPPTPSGRALPPADFDF